ncbi:uncharacterized protein LOC132902025, partial [Amyelois transitella]|uniref:uncharacterized protein LOC132902025 n=1 Tax=Amyelois transitella TaxID=680683 RepID=UPI0029907075
KDSSLEDDRNSSPSLLTNIINTADEQGYDHSFPSISSLPIISPLSNIPSVTPSFILNQISGSPQQSPQNVAPSQQSPQTIASSPHPTRALRRPNIVRRPRRVVNKRIALHFQWTKRHFQHRAELEPDVFVSPLPDEKFPLEYFSDFLSDDILEDTCQFTNMHAVQTTGRSLNLTVDEMHEFFAINLMMGVMTMTSYLDYWNTETRYPLIADIMPLKRYQQIQRHLHFVDNNQVNSDPYFKIRPFSEKNRQNCLKVEEDSRYSIDKMIIPFKQVVVPINFFAAY